MVGREIDVMSLTHPRMIAWRAAALGPDAAWRPTLVEIRGDDVRAFTGLGIGRRLARSIGLRDSLKVLRVIGDLEQEQRRGAAGRAEWPMLSRSGFFRTSIGATAALGFLGAGTANARPATTRSGLYAVSSVEGAEAVRQNVERVTATADFRNVVPPRLYNNMTSAARTLGSTSVDHVMNDGSALTATAVHDDESVVVVYEYTPVGAAAPVTTATEFRTDGDRLIRHATSRMGKTEREQIFSAAAGAMAQPLDCERCEVAPGSRSEQPCNACLEYNLTCVAQSCGGCAFAGDPIRVTACIGTLCAALVVVP